MSDWFKRVFLGIAVLGLLAAAPAQAQNGRGQGNGAGASGEVVQLRPTGVVPDQYIVVFEDDVTDPRGLANALARAHGFTLRHTYGVALRGFAARMSADMAEALADDLDVAYVEQDVYAHAVLHANDFQTLPSGVKRIDATANINGLDDRVNVDVAIIDTGVDLYHPDLNVFAAVDCTKGPNCESGGDGNDDNGHGTHVGGTVAALDNAIGVVGVAPGARLWGVKVLRKDGSGFFSDVIEGIDYVTANAADIEVANMSLGGTGSLNSLRTAIQNSVAAGVVFVVAAGNESRDVYGSDGVFPSNDDLIPASYPEAMTVSALADFEGLSGGLVPDNQATVTFQNVCPQTDYTHTGDDVFACFTNFSNSVVAGNPVTSAGNPVTSPGKAIDVAGPGLNILSTWMGGMYNTISGTSMASPHIAGAVALHIAANSRAYDAAGVADIRQALIDAAEPQTAWGPEDTKDPDSKHEGLVNAAGGPPPPSNDAPVVTITSPDTTPTSFDSGTTVALGATASDYENGNLTADLVWTVNGTELVTTGGSVSWTPEDGEYLIVASVSDYGVGEGENVKSGSDSITVTIGTAPLAPTVDRAEVSYDESGGRWGIKHLLITIAVIDDQGGMVADAAVSIRVNFDRKDDGSIDTARVGSGLTGAGGTITFIWSNAPSGGCYSTEVTVDGTALDASVVMDGGFCR